MKELRVYGSGGQGIITIGHLIGEAAIEDKKSVIMTEEYSPYVTGGWSRADLIISDEHIDYPMVSGLDYLITLTQEGLDTNMNMMKDNGLILFERSIVDYNGSNAIAVPAKEIAESLKSSRVANIVMLGAFAGASHVISRDSAITAIKRRFPKYENLNIEAFERGFREGEKHE